MKKRFYPLILLFLLMLCACGQSYQNDAPTSPQPVSLNESQQELADNIYAQPSLWRGCNRLRLYRHNGKLYLGANFLQKSSTIANPFGSGTTKVGTYKEYVYSIRNNNVYDDLSLADSGISSVATVVKQVYLTNATTEADTIALISQLVSYYNG